VLPWEKSIVYFVTMCVQNCERMGSACASRAGERALAVANFLEKKDCGGGTAIGTRRRVRSPNRSQSDNPVRHGLVQKAEEWPYRLDFINTDGKLTASPTDIQFAGVGGR
jgi:hypothetical protein